MGAITDPIGDLITRLRNAQMVGKKDTVVRKSKESGRCLTVLKQEGFIKDFVAVAGADGHEAYSVFLRYYPNGLPAIQKCARVSKPGRRIYRKVSEIKGVNSGLGISIISTSKGVITDRQALKLGVGGEVLVTVE